MQPHLVLRHSIVQRWAEAVEKEREKGVVLVSESDPVVASWIGEINSMVPKLTMKNACTRYVCSKTCAQCLEIGRAVVKSEKEALFVNYKSAKLVFVKIRAIRYAAIKTFEISRSVIGLFEEKEDVHIVETDSKKVFLPKKLLEYFRIIDEDYMNPVLIVQMVKYLEFEKKHREKTDDNYDMIIEGLKVGFFCDPVQIENSRLNLYRKNLKEAQGVPAP